MELYVVAFKREYETHVEVGKCIVTGEEPEIAIKKVCYHLNLKESAYVFKCTKLQPQVFQLDRTEIKKTQQQIDSGNIGGLPLKRSIYNISIDGQVSATDEIMAIKAISYFAIEKASGRDGRDKLDIIAFDTEIEKAAAPTRGLAQPYIEKQAIYKHTKVFQGGSCSPR